MAHDVFISHAKEDKQVAAEVCRALEEQGVRCWIAPRDVPPGVGYEQAILDAIEESRFLVLVFSAHANASLHVEREIRKASMDCTQTQVLPFRLENVPYNKVLYYYLGGAQWVDAWTRPLEDGVRSLIKRVRSCLDEVKAAPGATGGGLTVEEAAASRAAKPEGKARPLADGAGDARASKEEAEDAHTFQGTGDGRRKIPHGLRGTGDGRKKIPRAWLAAGAGVLSLLVAVAFAYWLVADPNSNNSNNSNSNSNNSNLVAIGDANVVPPLTPTPAANVAATPTPTATRPVTPTPTATGPATQPTPTRTTTTQPPADTNTQPQPGGTWQAELALEARRQQAMENNLSRHPGLRGVRWSSERGIVTLYGQVYSSSCRQAAESIARQAGVRLRANDIVVVEAPTTLPRERVSCAAGQ